jgi:putative DNA primase/helicase
VHEKDVNVKKTVKNEQKDNKNEQNTPVFVNDDKLIEIANNAKNGDKFKFLMDGRYEGRYSSQSEADIALCNLLAFYTRCDAGQMQRIFQRSKLYRDKWNEKRGEGGTYGEITIQKAIADCGETYTPPAAPRPKQEEAPEIDQGLDQLGDSPPEQLPEWITEPYNDTWNAERLIDRYGDDIKYNPSRGWFIWNGKHWEYDELDKIRTMANDSIEYLYLYKTAMYAKYEGKKTYSEYLNWLAKARNTSRKDNMIREAESWENIRTLPKQFDTDKCKVNLQNGTMDMQTMEFLPHNKSDLITKIMPVNYDPEAKTKLWDEFLNKIFKGNKNVIEFLQRATGYSFTALTNEQCIFILYGTGKNGKSTFLDAIKILMAEYARQAPVASFMKKDWSNTNTYELARLYGARLVTTGEPDKGDRFAESLIKQVTGGESINAEHKYKDPFEFYPEFKLWIGTNYKPEIVGTDLGIWRRIMLIPFDVVIPVAERDLNFGEKLLVELPGIFNWVMAGFKQWQKKGLDPPPEVLAATEDYREEMDVFQNFLNDCTVLTPGSVIRFKDLYKVYQEWAKENGIKNPMNSNTIGRRLKERGFKEHNTKEAKGREGIELSDEGKRLWQKGYEGVSENNEPKYYYQEAISDDDELPF